MIKELTKREFLKVYFHTLNANVSKKKKLSPNEIKVISELILKDEKQMSPINPYYGEGRELMLERTRLANSTYSTCLKKLSLKGLLIKGKQDYALHSNLVDLLTKIGTGKEVNISNRYRIADVNNLPKGSSKIEFARG